MRLLNVLREKGGQIFNAQESPVRGRTQQQFSPKPVRPQFLSLVKVIDSFKIFVLVENQDYFVPSNHRKGVVQSFSFQK